MKIVLIGDSIRVGYMHRVRELAGDRAEIAWPDANCGSSMTIREHLREWVIDHDPDIVHFNAGIHDLGWMRDETVPRFTVSAYVRNLRIIVNRLRKSTRARIVFANTTPFLIPLGPRPKDKCKPAPVVKRYNAAAGSLMQSMNVPVNDLYGAVMAAGVVDCLSDDKIHMGETGNEVLAAAVADALGVR